jgi:RNA polymerase sigma-70 factor (ECF subfamily)
MMAEVIDVDGEAAEPVVPSDARPAPAPADLDFDAFCRRQYASVASLAYVLTGSWTAAEDLTQDAFFAAFRGWEQVHRYERPEAWVRRVVANRAVSWWRRIGSEARALTRLQGRRAAGPEHAEIPERDAELWAIVRGLPARQAQVFALTVDDLPLDEIADVLGISPATAKTHLKRARRSVADLRSADPHYREEDS